MGNPFLADSERPISTLIYGPPKTKKTWFAGTAAEAGYNTIILDCDGNAEVLRNISAEGKKNIRVLDIADTTDKVVAIGFFAALFETGREFIWDATEKRVHPRVNKPDPTHWYCVIDTKKFTTNDVLVLDSWTALTRSIIAKHAEMNNLTLDSSDKLERDDWGFMNRLASKALLYWESLSSVVNTIMIGHEVTSTVKDPKDPNKILDIHTQPVSVTSNHGQQVARAFSACLYTYVSGSTLKISTAKREGRDGGATVIPPAEHRWEDLPYKKVMELAGAAKPNKTASEYNSEAFVFLSGEELAQRLALPAKAGLK
jgi:hypothetical protein